MKRFGPIAIIMLAFVLSALALVKVYDKGKDQKPLRFADIPQETIDWINSIGDGIDDILSIFNPTPRPTPWNNDGDPGKDPETGLSTLEDDYFIFYYPESLTRKARMCQSLAHEAIPHLEDMIGKYYYPKDMNGRKVPIYIMPNQEAFNDLMAKIYTKDRDYESVAGITIHEISSSGYYLLAIALNGRHCFRTDAYTKNVLWHEMTHYCFFASLDYSQQLNLPMWCTEGIAEYTSLPGERPKFTSDQISKMRNECDLTQPIFPYVFEVYDGGHSIYCHMEDRYQVNGVKAFLRTMYGNGIPVSLDKNFNITISEFESDWKANLDKFKK